MFYSTMDAAQIITASMLGIEPATVNGELPDAIGELTNIDRRLVPDPHGAHQGRNLGDLRTDRDGGF